ncbi:hypothetical protein KAFR_0C01950 [Kazachstania africana CBS 2517]|uniref:Pre-mRNA-splicing factor SYF2 n=1 Tax=Kazachstania africana (strain ATCC 22294 / BCRC 22015 / CBS 2517 / CECT 1963 / NBRC 1671 / NRRL Y-8276) TaxID=1071382 RepID=H2AS38_KAZAF|nr:hypothetical protein KAFR_0C01950 [Kazachstania africana CBS 2517]CCF57188.1 hypothetical protein KAFR_0C01950 [Kazachstania africana CBS 2517]
MEMDMANLREEFRDLRKKCREIKIENRKLISIASKPKTYSIREEEIGAEVSDEDEDDSEIIKLLTKPLREFETEAHVAENKEDIDRLTYNKEVMSLGKREKRDVESLVSEMNRISDERYKKGAQKRRRLKDTERGFINEQNKAFNLRLEKEKENGKK